MRYGENALNVIDRVKKKLKEIEPSLPQGVKIVTAYDRSDLILKSIATLKEKLIEAEPNPAYFKNNRFNNRFTLYFNILRQKSLGLFQNAVFAKFFNS